MANRVHLLRVSVFFNFYSTTILADCSISGEERWRSEGIQVGGPRSQRGVIGTWFDKDYDTHGPAGPTAFWKISDKGLYVEGEDSESEEESEED